MRNVGLLCALALLAGCAGGAPSLSTVGADLQQGQLVIDEGACLLQKDANAVGAAAPSGNVGAIAAATSIASGLLCMQTAPAPAAPASSK